MTWRHVLSLIAGIAIGYCVARGQLGEAEDRQQAQAVEVRE